MDVLPGLAQRRLGQSVLVPRVIGMGTWRTFDVSPQDAAAMEVRQRIVDEAIAAGVNFFDSSPMYGSAEEVLGLTLQGKRDQVMVAIKVWANSVEEGKRQIERALSFYGGYVDLFQVHNLVRWKEYLPILQRLQSEGKVRAIGVTHYAHSAFPEIVHIMKTQPIQSIQVPYNALDRGIEREILPLAEERGIGVIVMSPLATGNLVARTPPRPEVQRFAEYGVDSWAQILLKWVVSEQRVDTTIPATSKPGRMTENVRAGIPPWFGPEEQAKICDLARRYG